MSTHTHTCTQNILMSQSLELYVKLYSKRNSVDVKELRILRWEIIQVALMSLMWRLYEGWGRNQHERRQCDDGSRDNVMHLEDGGQGIQAGTRAEEDKETDPPLEPSEGTSLPKP